ncbi:MAG: RsmD family RNA methyltransferase [Bacteroidales bacterium]|nr:RsmD family RNA methyltransferase [Bacteroidales bacterium]
MRIISGYHRGKQIKAPDNLPVRPTTDFAKEGLFNVLNNYFHFDAVQVLDLFAGTGNISYEFAARGALSVVSVDSHAGCANFIRRTAQALDFKNISVFNLDAILFLNNCKSKFNIIFADPPYNWDSYAVLPQLVTDNNLLLPDGFLVIEHPVAISFREHPKFYQQRAYGKVNFSIFAENL